ncbi:beta-1,3-glucosyltransferase [Venturia canescens]|uniref:beta-1,3-glucosyltransferase n=1 Tax=Venturia canescens TaxID=32260 RepID=UPI001C9CA8F7|nr:beta-1,3-glucosyltransferase [Venturia canescens]
MLSLQSIFATLLIAIPQLSCFEPSELVVVVLSQQEGYHAAHANLLKDRIKNDAEILDKEPPKVILTHELSINGSWTFFPLLHRLKLENAGAKWFFFCLDNTGIRLDRLVKVLSKINERKEIWVGHAIYDREPTIIHHFADHTKKFKYPNTASGFALTKPLLASLSERFNTKGGPSQDFSIDAAYEFALFVLNSGNGVRFTHVPEFCVVASKDCATYPRSFHPCGEPVSRENIFVAVKTCQKYHTERIPVITKTWMKHVFHYGLFSDEMDSNVSNIYVVPHTEQGHCAKTHAILQKSYKILIEKNIDWLIIVDDDTILSMARLTRLLTCYNPSNLIAMGERYGFRVRNSTNSGYDYLTGGAGIVLSKPLVRKIIETRMCDCPSPTAPDDMYIFGYCLNLIDVPPVHSPLFHQARPLDYATGYLASQEPVSFHKFWMLDPYEVYEKWFAEIDESLNPQKKTEHTEL